MKHKKLIFTLTVSLVVIASVIIVGYSRVDQIVYTIVNIDGHDFYLSYGQPIGDYPDYGITLRSHDEGGFSLLGERMFVEVGDRLSAETLVIINNILPNEEGYVFVLNHSAPPDDCTHTFTEYRLHFDLHRPANSDFDCQFIIFDGERCADCGVWDSLTCTEYVFPVMLPIGKGAEYDCRCDVSRANKEEVDADPGFHVIINYNEIVIN